MCSKELLCLKYEHKIELNSGNKWEANETHTIGFEFELRDWRFPYIDYVLHGILPEDPKEASTIWKKKAVHFYYNFEIRTLYKKYYARVLLCCLSKKEAHEAIEESHSDLCEAHQLGPKF